MNSAVLILMCPILLHGQGNQPTQSDDRPWITNIRIDSLQGTDLIINGAVFYNDGNTPAKFAKVYAYQTGADGYYSQGGMDVTKSRYAGELTTNDKGHFIIETVIPGHYNYGSRARHVHFEITPKGGEMEEMILYFKGDKNMKEAYLEISDSLTSSYSAQAAIVRPAEKDKIGDYRIKRDFILKQDPPSEKE